MKLELKELKGLEGTPVTIDNQITGQIIELDPESKSKYVFIIDVGNMDHKSVTEQMKAWSLILKDLLGPNKALIAARSHGSNPLTIYELQPAEEAHSEEHI